MTKLKVVEEDGKCQSKLRRSEINNNKKKSKQKQRDKMILLLCEVVLVAGNCRREGGCAQSNFGCLASVAVQFKKTV